MRKTRILAAFLFLLVIITFSGTITHAQPVSGSFEIHFLDVGKADAFIVICDGQVLMIDGGAAKHSDLIFTYLRDTLGVTHIDYIVSTHPHKDHVGGLSGALKAATVGTIFSPVWEYDAKPFNSFLKYVNEYENTLIIPSAGDSYPLGGAIFQFLTPLRDDYEEVNDLSLVIRLVYGNTSFLFMGDAELSAEADLIMAGYTNRFDLSSTLLKIGHHGGDTSTSLALLQAVQPRYAVLTVDGDKDNGLPSLLTMERLNTADVDVFRTDVHGHIICYSDGETLWFVTQKNAQ
ncbi:MAG: MBL fold metallo-hydrolase [Eubacteriales bacterium]|nr:MBL fold metallo-hydrolase [Eubacteriales bacterium]